MKNRILTFAIGILVGSIIATTGFLIYSKSVNKNERTSMMPNGQMQPPDWNTGERPIRQRGDFQPKVQND